MHMFITKYTIIVLLLFYDVPTILSNSTNSKHIHDCFPALIELEQCHERHLSNHIIVKSYSYPH